MSATWLKALGNRDVGRLPWVNTDPGHSRPAFAAAPQPLDPLAPAKATLAQKIAELEGVIARYQGGLAKLAKAQAELDDRTTHALTELAFTVGRELALAEIERKPEIVADLIRRLAGGQLAGDSTTTVSVAPQDLERLMDHPAVQDQRIVADPSLSPGSCVVQSNDGRIDASFALRERRLRGALGLESSVP